GLEPGLEARRRMLGQEAHQVAGPVRERRRQRGGLHGHVLNVPHRDRLEQRRSWCKNGGRPPSHAARGAAMLTQDVVQIASPALNSERALRRVLVAFDGTPGAWAALDRGITLALGSNALLTVAGVVGSPPPLGCGMAGVLVPPYTPDELQRELDVEM